jgi:hypothetical protein
MLTKMVDQINQSMTVEHAENLFPAIAEVMLNKTLLEINDKDYHLLEIEFYFLHTSYKNQFVQGNKRQVISEMSLSLIELLKQNQHPEKQAQIKEKLEETVKNFVFDS